MSHSKFSPSSYSRWSKCPGVLNLIEAHPELQNKTSFYADEGTRAHELAAKILTAKSIDNPDDELSIYIDYCVKLIEASTTHFWVEQKLQIPDTEIFGTADFICYNPSTETLSVVDLKWGSGVGVEVVGNTQLRIYALMALMTLPKITPKKVEITVVQPRFSHPDGPIRTEILSPLDILDFQEELFAAVDAAQKEDAPTTAGDHCRWCPVISVCPSIKAKVNETAVQVFSPVEEQTFLTTDKIGEILEWLPRFEDWIKGMRELAFKKLSNGEKVPGYKLVEKRPSRKWAVEEIKAIQELSKLGLETYELYESKFKSVAQVEKLLEKKEARSGAFQALITKESSGLTIVEESDRRSAVNPRDATTIFTAITDETRGE